jgi:hypothetical protein
VTATGWVNVATDPLNERGLVMLSTVTLPPKWMPPDNQLVSYDVIVRAGSPGQNDGQNDRFLDMILLDVTGSTVACVVAGANGFANWFVDEPESGQSMGAILGSNFGRTGAVSATDTIILASGGPFVLEPGAENLFLAYCPDQVDRSTGPDNPGTYLGSPALAADYYARWWFDRADDLYAPPAEGGGAGGGTPGRLVVPRRRT